ncbi:MAG: hypothetical protein RLW62_20980, partial [Gammaproteobacteria bacterium]
MAEPARAPLIGVTGPARGGFAAWCATRFALARVGARVVRISPRRGLPAPLPDGFVIGGGADIGWQAWETLPDDEDDQRRRRLLDLVLFPLIALARTLAGKRQRTQENA